MTTREPPIYPVSFLSCVLLIGALACSPLIADQPKDAWPPAPQLERPAAASDAAPLPPSITAEPLEKDLWRCTFRFRLPTTPEVPEAAQPAGPAAPAAAPVQKIALVGSFNNWDREATPMSAAGAGEWVAHIELDTGVYQYKFLVDGDQWHSDPQNTDQTPDGFGKFNSFLRLGQLAQMRASDAKPGDKRIDGIGLAHDAPAPLYVQTVASDQLAVRYRTLAHDVQKVWLAVRDGPLSEMRVASEGPLFAYWETRVPVPAKENPRSPKVRGLDYTFVLDDGGEQVCDPYTYHYTVTPAGQIETPEWAKHAVWYQIMLDRFRDGDPANNPPRVRPWTSAWFTPSPWESEDTFYRFDAFERAYGGDLAGLEAQLPYLRDLGVNALYLTPVFKAPSYHKYDVQDYRHIDDAFGTRGDYEAVVAQEDLRNPATWKWTETDKRFIAFLKKAHELGFKVILDGVFNHVGAQHPAFADVQEHGKESPFADWFDVTSWDPFAYRGWADFAHMPVFKKNHTGFASPGVKDHLFAITRRWMDPDGDGRPDDGIDGWRLDVPNDVPRPFWAEWRRLVKQVNPDAFITGEVWNRADKWLDGEHFDAVMNYEFAKTVCQWIFDRQNKIPASAAAARFAELRLAYPAAATYALQNLVDSHDTDRLASMAENPDREYDRQNRVQDNNPQYSNAKPSAASYARARLVALLQMTYVGAPLIYYGDEAGMWGADDPTSRKPMLWKDLEPYEQPDENRVDEAQLAFYRAAIALRNAHPALRTGGLTNLLADDAADVWAFLRCDADGTAGEKGAAGEQLIVVLNASEKQADVKIPLPQGAPQGWVVLFPADASAPSLPASDGRLALTVPALAGVVLQGGAK